MVSSAIHATLTVWQVPAASASVSRWHFPLSQQSAEAAQPNLVAFTQVWQLPPRSVASSRWHLPPPQQSAVAAQPNEASARQVWQLPSGASTLARWHLLPEQQLSAPVQPNLETARHDWQAPVVELASSFWQYSAVAPGQQLSCVRQGPPAAEHLQDRPPPPVTHMKSVQQLSVVAEHPNLLSVMHYGQQRGSTHGGGHAGRQAGR